MTTPTLNEKDNLISVKSNPINQARLANLAKAREALALKKLNVGKDTSLLRDQESENTANQEFTRKRVRPDFDVIELDDGAEFPPPYKKYRDNGGDVCPNIGSTIMGSFARFTIGIGFYFITQAALRYALDNGYIDKVDVNSRSNQSNTTKQQLKPGEYLPGQFIIR